MARIEADKIAVLRLSALGDMVHALPLVNGLRIGYPEAEISWITQPLSSEMVKHQQAVDRFILFENYRGLSCWRDFHRKMKTEKFDLLLVPQVSLKSSLVAAMIHARTKLGFDFRRSRELHYFFMNRHIEPNVPQHVQDQFLEFLDYLQVDYGEPRWDFTFTDDEIHWRDQYFSQFDRPVIAIILASSNPEKDVSTDVYAKLIDRIETTLPFQPLLMGGPSHREKSLADTICSICQTKPPVALEKPVRHTLLQLSGASIVVSPDTGPLHAAVAMGIPTIGLYGFSNPRRCGPYRKFSDLLIDKYTDENEVNELITRKTKPGRMKQIASEEIYQKILVAIYKYLKRELNLGFDISLHDAQQS